MDVLREEIKSTYCLIPDVKIALSITFLYMRLVLKPPLQRATA
jgi:hypothetical protein